MGEIVLVRHGETEWSRDGRHTGRSDVVLTPLGAQQARALGALLHGRRFVAVLTSPLSRARETARLAGLVDAQTDTNLAEWDYGAYDGRSTAQIRTERAGWDLWRDGVVDGETVDDVGRRADDVLARVRPCLADGDVALVGHGHALRVLAARWLGLPAQGGRLLALDTATMSVLGHEREREVLRTWNLVPSASAAAHAG